MFCFVTVRSYCKTNQSRSGDDVLRPQYSILYVGSFRCANYSRYSIEALIDEMHKCLRHSIEGMVIRKFIVWGVGSILDILYDNTQVQHSINKSS